MDIPEDIEIALNIDGKIIDSSVMKIDRNHGNPKLLWLQRGMPEYLSKTQIDEKKEKTSIRKEPIKTEQKDGKYILSTDFFCNSVIVYVEILSSLIYNKYTQ